MKGLLIKDLRLIWHNKKFIVVLLFSLIIFFMLWSGKEEGDGIVVVSYLTAICGILVLNTISYDDYDKSICFLMVMPINRAIYAKEKYIFSFLFSLAGWIVGMFFCIAQKQGAELLLPAIAVWMVLTIFQMILIPVQLKYGDGRGRIALVVIWGFIMMLLAIIDNAKNSAMGAMLIKNGKDLISWITSFDRIVLYFIIGLFWTVCFFFSLIISKRIMQKKEF